MIHTSLRKRKRVIPKWCLWRYHLIQVDLLLKVRKISASLPEAEADMVLKIIMTYNHQYSTSSITDRTGGVDTVNIWTNHRPGVAILKIWTLNLQLLPRERLKEIKKNPDPVHQEGSHQSLVEDLQRHLTQLELREKDQELLLESLIDQHRKAFQDPFQDQIGNEMKKLI